MKRPTKLALMFMLTACGGDPSDPQDAYEKDVVEGTWSITVQKNADNDCPDTHEGIILLDSSTRFHQGYSWKIEQALAKGLGGEDYLSVRITTGMPGGVLEGTAFPEREHESTMQLSGTSTKNSPDAATVYGLVTDHRDGTRELRGTFDFLYGDCNDWYDVHGTAPPAIELP